jgi:hypothetical protein
MHKHTPRLLRTLPAGGEKTKFLSKFLPRRTNLTLRGNSFEVVSKIRHSHIANAYFGETAYVLSCGPSLDKVWDEKLKGFLADKLIISVKQAHDKAPEITDFHLYNEVRMKEYDYPGDTIRISCSKFSRDHPSHIHYPVREYKWEKTLFVTNQYERWDLAKSYERPWGVGIMFELGLFLPVYLGCKRMLIMGFDMNSAGKYHFYDPSEKENFSFYSVDKEEFHFARMSIHYFMKWAQKKGVEARLYSPLSTLPFSRIDNIYSWA